MTRVASLEAETDQAAERILDVSGVTESKQASLSTVPSVYPSTVARLAHFWLCSGCSAYALSLCLSLNWKW